MQINNLADVLFQMAQECPDAIALKDSSGAYSYRQVWEQAQQVAAFLEMQGIRKDDRIVVFSRKNAASLICFWGVMFCEAIPVMLDQEEGIGANAAKTRDVKARAVVLDTTALQEVVDFGCNLVIDFKDLDAAVVPRPGSTLRSRAMPDDLCYILLTSGTTGKSKAVQISHGNVLHYAYAIHAKLGAPDKVAAIHASTFAADLGLTNLLVALVSGGMLRIMNRLESTDPALFWQIIEADNISLVKITPSHLLALLAGLREPLKRPVHSIVLGGEKLSWETIKIIYAEQVCTHLYNHYGPTEATIGAVAFKIEPDSVHFAVSGSVPLGSPLGNGVCFIDTQEGDTGELYITGPGISSGYLDNEPENQNKFFRKLVDGKDVVSYRTGDICRKHKDGNYEFLYRTDRQVKVKGYRIELGEVELAIAAHPAVENAYVCLSGQESHTVMEAYVKLPSGVAADINMHDWLVNSLPAYKIPSLFHFYWEAPYNSNGKIDLQALKKRFQSSIPMVDAAMADPVAGWKAVVENTWRSLLQKTAIDPADDFFETGGDSLLAIQFVGKLQRHGYNVHITDLNNHSVLRDLLALDPDWSNRQAPVSYERDGFVTASQHWWLGNDQWDQSRYCQAVLLEASDKIMLREMGLAVQSVVQNHLLLSRNYARRPVIRVGGTDAFFGVTVLDPGRPLALQMQEEALRLMGRISLEAGPLFIVHVFIDQSGRDHVYLLAHHMVIDVISWNIILEELCDAYAALLAHRQPLMAPENSVHAFYQAVTAATAGSIRVQSFNTSKMYRLPRAGSNSRTSAVPVGVLCAVIPPGASTYLRGLGDHPVSFNGLLLNALSAALIKEFSLPALTVDVEFHGRPQENDLPDLSRSVGWWATTMPVTVDGTADAAGCTKVIQAVAEQANRLNLNYPHGLPSYANGDVRLNYLGHFPARFGNEAIQLRPSAFNAGHTRSDEAHEQYKLYLTARFIGQSLQIDLQYSRRYFSEAVVERIADRFSGQLEQVMKAGNGGRPVDGWLWVKTTMPAVGLPMHTIACNTTLQAQETVIFITGATGFLGIHLVHQLLADPRVVLYCLVRGRDEAHAAQRLLTTYAHFFDELPEEQRKRLHIIKGDLVQIQMGMTDAWYRLIADHAAVIIHGAADTNLMRSYRELQATNVQPIHHVLALAGVGKSKSVHYISTLSVCGCLPGDGHAFFSEDDFDYGQVFVSDYERTKFEAEKMIRTFLDQGGAGCVYRVGHVAADSVYGRFQRNIEQNRIFQIIRGMMELGRFPYDCTEQLSFSQVDIVAAGIVHRIRGGRSDRRCFHVDSPHYLSLAALVPMLKEAGYAVELTGRADYATAIACFEGGVAAKRSVDLMNNWVERAYGFPRRVSIVSTRTIDLLSAGGISFPAVSSQWFHCMLAEGVRAGYFTTPTYDVSGPAFQKLIGEERY
ncbi:AMP-binding protein [Paraflavitalea pollutisoli]|uniref:AMP-binding protein n=1 Tax=Paraflavitalea pollutisoli TaxID=3034143 RepID=UPI0023ECC6AE|nr:AMP-binding protein [Paraflavitalea sp. H1-2-19X]